LWLGICLPITVGELCPRDGAGGPFARAGTDPGLARQGTA